MSVIKDNMQFTTFNEFYDKRTLIKKNFENASDVYKEVYKMYVFSNRILTNSKAEIIWEFLIEPSDSDFNVKKRDLERLYKSKGVK